MSSLQERYIAAMVSLTPDRLDSYIDLFAPDGRFKDPFHDVRGRAAIRTVFVKMYKILSDVRFEPRAQATHRDTLLLSWTFTAKQRWLGKVRISGASEITFAADGLVREHIDYWDKANLYKHFNIAGQAIGAVALLVRR